MSKQTFAADYIDVASRIVEFREKHPDGSLQPADVSQPYRVERIGDETYIVVVAAAYRSPEDTRPGIGMAYEIYPGRTPYTRGSELQNAETSAWGRAIMAALAADARKGVASADEMRNRQAERDQAEPAPPRKPSKAPTAADNLRKAIAEFVTEQGWSLEAIAQEFTKKYKESIRDTQSVEKLNAFFRGLETEAQNAAAQAAEATAAADEAGAA